VVRIAWKAGVEAVFHSHGGRERRVIAAVAVALLILGALAIAAHSRAQRVEPGPATRPIPAPPQCFSGGNVCGQASAVVRSGGQWQVIRSGRCVGHGRLYFGIDSTTQLAHAWLALMVDIPSGVPAQGGGPARVVDGRVKIVPGVDERVSGTAIVQPGGSSGAFNVHGRDAHGFPDGSTYVGAWTCRAGHPPRSAGATAASTAPPPQCTQQEIQDGANAGFVFSAGAVSRHGWNLDCGPASAVVRAAGRWQLVSAGRCVDRGRLYFGASTDRRVPQRSLGFGVSVPDSMFAHGGPSAVDDGEITIVPGAHAALSGSATVAPKAIGGGFDLYGRGPDHGRYVGAWSCGP
jgi:hypothetical protein